MKRSKKVPFFEESSGNVFRDLGFARPDDELAKAMLIMELGDVVQGRGWSQAETAAALGIPQSKVSLLLRGHSEGFSTGRLMTLLTRLGQDVDIVVRPAKGRSRRARVRVLRGAFGGHRAAPTAPAR